MAIHQLLVSHVAGATSHQFLNLDKAQAAYDKIRSALNEYKEYGNDKEKAVEVELESGKTTIRMHHAISVSINIGDDELEKSFRTEHERMRKLLGIKKTKSP